MSIDWKKYSCKYVAEFFAGDWRHNYTVICALGAISFHHTDRYESAGLEIHYRYPPDYKKWDAPSHSPCGILGAPCWHDGTSLYATDTLLPRIKGSSLNEIFSILTNECSKRFDLEPTTGEGGK